MRDGFLPAAPRKDGCKHCEYLPVCGPYEEERVAEKSQAELKELKELRGMAMSSGPTVAACPISSQSWVVEASAGTGKTTALVDRIVEVIAAGTPVDTIVAVTFTHAAAGNMKLRVRHELEQRRAAEPDPACATGSPRRRAASIAPSSAPSTPFARNCCAAVPWKRGVDPVFQELAQPDALRVFGRVFRRWIETPTVRALARPVARAGAPGVARERDDGEPLDELRNAAWNLAEWRDFDAPWDKRAFDRDARLRHLIDTAEDLRCASAAPRRPTARRTSAPCANSC